MENLLREEPPSPTPAASAKKGGFTSQSNSVASSRSASPAVLASPTAQPPPYAQPPAFALADAASPVPSARANGVLKMAGGQIELKKKEPLLPQLERSVTPQPGASQMPEVDRPRKLLEGSISRESSNPESLHHLDGSSAGSSVKARKSKMSLRSAMSFKPQIYYPAASKYDFLLPSLIKNQPPKLT
jgi:hypothetical protein